MNHCRSVSAYLFINVAPNGSVSVNTIIEHLGNLHPYDLNYDITGVIETSIGPRDNYDGIRSCFTYNPIAGSKPGYQLRRGVSDVQSVM